MTACLFPSWSDAGCVDVDDGDAPGCSGWFLGQPPPASQGTLRIYVDRAVGIAKGSRKPVVKVVDKETGDVSGATSPAQTNGSSEPGTYVWAEEVRCAVPGSKRFRDASRTLRLLVFIKESRRQSFHTHHDSLAGHVLDVPLASIEAAQAAGWVEKRLKLTPRGYLVARLRYEAGDDADEVPLDGDEAGPTGEPLTPFERHLRANSPKLRDPVDEAAYSRGAEERKEAASPFF